MRFKRIVLGVLCIGLGFCACSNDDNPGAARQPLTTLEEQQALDEVTIEEYLRTHFYNASTFDNEGSRLQDLEITERQTEGSIRLMDAVTEAELSLGGLTVKYYFLNLRQGAGTNSPTFADRVRVVYRGVNLVNDAVFEDQIANPMAFNLPSTIIGWQNVFPNFRAATNFSIENDGTVNFESPGVGVMFLPSTIAYFRLETNDNTASTVFLPLQTANAAGGVDRMPLMFQFELLQVFEDDIDGDGIPSHLEDLNNDGAIINGEDDDTDLDGTPNVNDADDDNDGVLTEDEIVVSFVEETTRAAIENTALEDNQFLANFIEELRDETGNITGFRGRIITFFDTDNDGVFNHLDANDTTVISEL